MADNQKIDFEPVAFEPDADTTKSVADALTENLTSVGHKAKGAIDAITPSEEELEAALTGAAQGATLGWGSELYGGAKALGQGIGQGNLSNFPELYRLYQQQAQNRIDQIQAAAPKSFLAGQLGGGLLSGLATAGALAPEAAAASLGSKIATGAATGAGLGAINAAGVSQGNIDTPESRQKLLADTLGGGAMGGVLGGAVPAVLSPFQALKRAASGYAEEAPLVRQTLKSYAMGRAGQAVNESESSVNQMTDELRNDLLGATEQVRNAKDALGKQIGTLYDNATAMGTKVDVNPALKGMTQDLMDSMQKNRLVFGTRESDQILDQLNKLQNGQLTPNAARTLRDNVGGMLGQIDAPELQGPLSRFSQGVKDALNEAVPGLEEMNAKYNSFLKNVPETIVTGAKPSEYVQNFLSNMDNPNANIFQGLKDMAKSLSTPGVSKIDARDAMSQLKSGLAQFESENPGMLEQLGMGTPDQFTKNIADISDKYAIQRQILGYEPHGAGGPAGPLGLVASIGNTFRGATLGTANVAGRLVKAATENGPAKFARNLYQAPPEYLGQVADQLSMSGVPGLSHYGDALKAGLQQKNSAMTNAALFTILQNPQARLLISPKDLTNESRNATANPGTGFEEDDHS